MDRTSESSLNLRRAFVSKDPARPAPTRPARPHSFVSKRNGSTPITERRFPRNAEKKKRRSEEEQKTLAFWGETKNYPPLIDDQGTQNKLFTSPHIYFNNTAKLTP